MHNLDCLSVILNGPPGSGKDTIGEMLRKTFNNVYMKSGRGYIPVNVHQFKAKLLTLTKEIYNVNDKDFFDIYDDRVLKETPMELFGGISVRDAMIKVSETVIKPVFGKDYFGKIAAQNLVEGVNVFTDGGFHDEILPLTEKSKVVIIHLTREGCDFSKDSRRYIDSVEDAIYLRFDNNFNTLKDLEDALYGFYVRNILQLII